MRRRPPKLIHLKRKDRQEMRRLLDDGRTEQRVARRCRVLLAMEDPDTLVEALTHEVHLTRTGVWYVCRRYELTGLDAVYDAPRPGRPREISELERVAIQQLACCELHGLKLELMQWSTRSLTVMARQRLHRPRLAHSTVSLILREADLKLHHSRSWITPTLDAEFVRRATRILWLYERVKWLLAHDEIVIAIDEKPNLQALERARPTQPMRAGQGERQEFEYERHGTVNFLGVLILHSGEMRACCLEQNDSEHLCRALPKLLAPFRKWRRVHLIWDGGPSHASAPTRTFLRSYGSWLRVLFTPPHSEWLNQAELLLKSFTVYYLKRGSWRSRQELIDHLYASVPEYNRWFAQPINQLEMDPPRFTGLGGMEDGGTMLNYLSNAPLERTAKGLREEIKTTADTLREEMTNEFKATADVLMEGLQEALKDTFQKYRDETLSKMSEMVAEVKAYREEQTAHQGQHNALTDRVEKLKALHPQGQHPQ